MNLRPMTKSETILFPRFSNLHDICLISSYGRIFYIIFLKTASTYCVRGHLSTFIEQKEFPSNDSAIEYVTKLRFNLETKNATKISVLRMLLGSALRDGIIDIDVLQSLQHGHFTVEDLVGPVIEASKQKSTEFEYGKFEKWIW